MYDIVVVGNPLLRCNGLNESGVFSVVPAGPPVNTGLTIASLGVEEMVLVGKTESRYHEEAASGLGLLGIPEYYLSESGPGCSVDVVLDLEGTITEHYACPEPIGIREIPSEFLGAKRMILSPSFQEVDLELLRWLSTSSSAGMVWNPQMHRVRESGEIRLGLTDHQFKETLRFVEVVELNQPESYLLTSEKDPLVAAELLVEWGARIGVVTLGDRGCILYDGAEFIQMPAYTVHPSHTYGAGDVLVAALTVSLNRCDDLLESCAYASAVASIFVEGNGGRYELMSTEIRHRTDELHGLARVS